MNKTTFIAVLVFHLFVVLAAGAGSVSNRYSTGVSAKPAFALAPMRLIYGIPSQVGAIPFITEVSADGLALLNELPHSFTNGEFSFDGEFIAFDNCGDRFGNPYGIYVVKLAEQKRRQVLFLPGKICTSVRWAPTENKCHLAVR